MPELTAQLLNVLQRPAAGGCDGEQPLAPAAPFGSSPAQRGGDKAFFFQPDQRVVHRAKGHLPARVLLKFLAHRNAVGLPVQYGHHQQNNLFKFA